MKQAVVTIYLRNGCSFALRPTDPAFKPPHESELARMMSDDKTIMALAQATPTVVIRWAEVVAIMVSEESVDDAAGTYA